MLNGKTAVVTGGSRGIGRAVCTALAENGANIAFLSRGGAGAEQTERELEALGVTARGYVCDVADYGQTEQVFKQIIADFGSFDILVNNAGITDDKLLLSMKPDSFDKVLRTNLYGVYNTVKQAYPVFMKKRSGRIINISSVSGLIGNAGQANYSASKAAVIGFTKSVARELASRGVTCNAIAPGFVETDMTADFTQNEAIIGQIPMKRFAKPEEIAAVCAFLASDGASYITGSVICADGGMTCIS